MAWLPGMPEASMPPYTLFRLPDTAFWLVVLCGALFCLGVAATRAVRPPAPSGAFPWEGGAERHTLFRRVFHWGSFLSVAILLFSGLAMYRSPILPDPGGPAALWFAWHLWGTPAFLALMAAHIIHEYRVSGEPLHMWLGRHGSRKYRPAQILFHWAVAANLLALAVTGAVLWKPLRALLPLSLVGLGWEFIFYNRILHGLFTATFMALLLAHVYFALAVRENWARMRAMLTGWERG